MKNLSISPVKTYLITEQLSHRYGQISKSTVWRWVNDPVLGFPKPIRIGQRNLWDVEDLDAFDTRIKNG